MLTYQGWQPCIEDMVLSENSLYDLLIISYYGPIFFAEDCTLYLRPQLYLKKIFLQQVLNLLVDLLENLQ